MLDILFLSVPSHGHVNPTVGLASELVNRGSAVTYFSAPPFRNRIEATGAEFKSYAADLDMFRPPKNRLAAEEPGSDSQTSPLLRIVRSGPTVVADILAQTKDRKFDCLIYSAPFPFAKPMAQILGVPTVSSLGIFFGLDVFFEEARKPTSKSSFVGPQMDAIYEQAAHEFATTYGVRMPDSLLELIFNRGDLNLVYTSRYFAGLLPYFDDTFKFVGPPVFDRKEQVEFPFQLLAGKQLLYISLGTVFGGISPHLYEIFFQAFADWDGMVVLAAHNVDHSGFAIPPNFIVRDYVPQNEVLRHADAAITHCGMNSLNDILVHEVPFVCLPMGADQPLLAARAQDLGATLVLDVNTLTPAQLRSAVQTVRSDPGYLANIRNIGNSFRAAGGYPRAVDEILKLAIP